MILKPNTFKVFYSPPDESIWRSIFVSTDTTKTKQAKHKFLVEQLKSQRARGESDVIIHGDSIASRSKSQRDSKLGSRDLGVHWKVSYPELSTYISWREVFISNGSRSHKQLPSSNSSYLCGPQVIQTILEYLFLNNYYYLLYNSVILYYVLSGIQAVSLPIF